MNLMKILLAASICALATTVSAQVSGTVETNVFNVEGFVKGSRITVDADFATENSIAVPAPFDFIVPEGDDQKLFSAAAPGGSGIIKIVFTDLDENPRSNLQFLPYTVDMGTVEERLQWSAPVLKDFFIASIIDPERAAINVTRAIEVGPYQAIEMLGNYDAGEYGVAVLRIVAIPHPDNENGIIAIINGLTEFFPMDSVDDIMETNASRALGTFRFR